MQISVMKIMNMLLNVDLQSCKKLILYFRYKTHTFMQNIIMSIINLTKTFFSKLVGPWISMSFTAQL